MLNHAATGPEAGLPLLLVHPMGADLTFWDGFRAELGPSFRTIAVDLRGAGLSPAISQPVSIVEHADDLAGFCRELGIARVVAVGCAVGAMIATVLAGRHAGLCAGLVASNPGYRTLPEAREALSGRAAAVRAQGMAAVADVVIEASFAGCPADARRDDFAARFVRQDPARYALQIEGMLDADTSPWLAAIAAPTLIVAGGRDTLLPPDHARRLHAEIAGAELTILPGGAHFIPYQRPAEFAGLVAAFLARAAV